MNKISALKIWVSIAFLFSKQQDKKIKMDVDKIVEITESVVDAVAEELPCASKRVKGFLDDLNENKPEIASGLMIASSICK